MDDTLDTPCQYNSKTVIDAADTKLQEEGVNAAQTVFKTGLLDWVDEVTMGDTRIDDKMRGEIANLWLAYANLNKRSNLFKSATEVYEEATKCPVAGKVGKVWVEFANFLEERGRTRTAQKIYLRALVGQGGEDGDGPCVKDPIDQAMLWDGFLRMMQSFRKNPDLTLDDLKKAVQKEHLGRSGDGNEGKNEVSNDVVPDQRCSLSNNEQVTEADVGRPTKRSRWDNKSLTETDKVRANNIDTAAGILVTTSKNMPAEIETLWLARDGGSLPTRPEPALFAASPPKLGDPSGKDLVGNETALKILEMLTSKTHGGKSLGTALLDLCHACWMMTALKEEEVLKARESLEKKIITDKEAMETDLNTRASVAGGALLAVQQANEKERNSFTIQSEAQREQLLSSSAWEFRKLLYSQQIIMTNAKLPGFDGPTVDSSAIAFQSKICSVMHSAFYLRARVGEASHVNMLNKQLESIKKLTSVKNEPAEEPQYQAPFQMQHQPMQYQQPVMPPQPMMYTGQHQLQPMAGVTPIVYQSMPVGFQPQVAQPPQGQVINPHQFLGQMNPQNLSQQQ